MTPNDVKIVADNIDDFIEVFDGIERLRKAVLTLAVAGKLVAQDKKEGTAEDLYSKIQEEKSVVSNKKKRKEVFLIDQSEILFEIPETWKWVRLSEISSIFNGNSINKHEKELKYKGAIGIPYIGTKDVGFDHIINYESGVSIPKTELSNFKIASKDSVFVCAEGGSAGRKVAHLEQDVFFGNKLFAIHPPSILDSKYIFYYCISSEFYNSFQSAMSGLIGGVSINKFGDLLLPLPPSGEQKRIVKKVEEVMKQLDELEVKKLERDATRTRLARSAMQSLGKGESKIAFEQLIELVKTPSDVKELENALLTLAVSGKLVQQSKADGTAEDLYNQIHKVRIKAEENSTARKRKTKDLEPISNEEIPFEIPKSWKWVRLGDVFLVERGGSPRPIESYITSDPNGLNWIKIGDTEQGGKYISSTKEKIIPAGLKKTRMVHKGDLLLTNSMSFGRPYILEIDGCIHDGWLVLQPYFKDTVRDFFYHTLSSSVFFQQFVSLVSGAVVKNLNADKVKSALIPLPPIAEQKRIVKKVEEIMVLIDRLKQVIGEK